MQYCFGIDVEACSSSAYIYMLGTYDCSLFRELEPEQVRQTTKRALSVDTIPIAVKSVENLFDSMFLVHDPALSYVIAVTYIYFILTTLGMRSSERYLRNIKTPFSRPLCISVQL